MNTFRTKNRIKKFYALQSSLSLILAFILYTALSTWFLTPSIRSVEEKEGSLLFLSTDCKDPVRGSLQKAIASAQSSIVLVTYSLADKKIISSLQEASSKNVPISLVYDADATPEAPVFREKTAVCLGKKGHGLMHQKLLVIDDDMVWLGSANMTTSSLLQHGNLVTAIRSRVLADEIKAYATNFFSRTEYHAPPLQVRFPEQTLTLYIHPLHAQQSLRNLIQRIDAAQKRVFVAMYTFTHEDLFQALKRAQKREVDVRVIFDKDSIRQASKKVYMSCKREKMKALFRKKTGLLHYKSAIIDSTLIVGSANWTKAAFKINDDFVLCIDPLIPEQEKWIEAWWNAVEDQAT